MKLENSVVSTKEYIDIQMESTHDKLALRAEDRFNKIIDRMDSKFDHMDSKFDRIEAKFDARFNHLDTRFNWIGGLVVTLIIAIFINIFIR
jgi:hypothetical protein